MGGVWRGRGRRFYGDRCEGKYSSLSFPSNNAYLLAVNVPTDMLQRGHRETRHLCVVLKVQVTADVGESGERGGCFAAAVFNMQRAINGGWAETKQCQRRAGHSVKRHVAANTDDAAHAAVHCRCIGARERDVSGDGSAGTPSCCVPFNDIPSGTSGGHGASRKAYNAQHSTEYTW